METRRIRLTDLEQNKGQVPGLPSNPRQWGRKELDDLVKSIRETPELLEARGLIVWPYEGKYIILGGNMRFSALREMNAADAPCYVLPEDTPMEKLREITIKDNSSFGAWDYDMLANEWDDLPLPDWGVPAWDTAELHEAPAAEAKDVKEDDFDEEKEHIEVRCKRGDVWQLGDHRLMCGDSVSLEDVKRLMGGVLADMVFTDPPYGIDYSGGRTQTVSKKDYGKLKNDDLQGAELGNLICNIFQFNKEGADVYVCVSPIMQKPFLDYLDGAGRKTDAVIVWDKKQPGLGYMAYRRQCEFILFVKGGRFHKGDKSDVDLWSINRDDGQTYVHGTQKPVAVSARAINNSSKEGDVVLDLFGGSGSTLLACEQLNRHCRMMELDPHFADVIIARWEKFTGKNAVKVE